MLCAALLAFAAGVAAEPRSNAVIAELDAESLKSASRSLMAKGRAARAAGDHRTALEAFSQAHAMMNVPTTLYEVAVTEADLGELLSAKRSLEELERMPRTANEPAAFARAREAAVEFRARLNARIPKLELSFEGADAGAPIDVSVDGKQVNVNGTSAELELDPGEHRIEAWAGIRNVSERVVLRDAEVRKVQIKFRSEAPARAVVRPAVISTPKPSAQMATPAASTTHTTVMYALGASAIAGLGLGTVFAFVGRNRELKLISTCAPNCSSADVDGVRGYYTVANISFAVGAASALGALGVLVFRPFDGSKTPQRERDLIRVRVAPELAGGGVYAEGQF
jgi:hypothetical protein